MKKGLQTSIPLKFLGSMSEMGVYNKQPLPCNNISEMNLS